MAGYFLGEISSESNTIIRRQITWGCKRNFITWLDDIRGLSNSVRMMDYRFRGTKFILNEYLVARDELSIHTRDIAGYLLYVGAGCTVARNDR